MTDQQRPVSGDSVEGQRRGRPSLFAWLRARFFAGMVIALPIAVTFLILQFLINEIDKRVVPLLPAVVKPETYVDYAVPGFGVVVLILALTLLGAIATNLIGRSIIAASDRVLNRIPVARNIYSALRQLVDVFASNNTDQFDSVVLVEYPKRGTWCIGFVSTQAKGEISARLGGSFIAVFVPTTPNPTSGFLIYVPSVEVIRLDMSVEEGAKMILSAGLVVPEHLVPDDGVPTDGETSGGGPVEQALSLSTPSDAPGGKDRAAE